MSNQPSGNSGVQVTGGTVNVQAMAVGDHARATVNNAAGALQAAGHDDVAARLAAVLDALERHGAALPNAKEASELVEEIATEVAKKEPKATRVRSFLASLADQVKSVSTIATAVTGLAGAVWPMLS